MNLYKAVSYHICVSKYWHRTEYGTIGVIWTNIQLYVIDEQYIFNFTVVTNEYASFTYILTIAPWPTFKLGNAFVITGKLIDAVTLQRYVTWIPS